jgi:hypothetical protein
MSIRLSQGLVVLSAVGLFALTSHQARAVTYNDTVGDLGGGATATILDITSVEVTHDATDIQFKINLAGDPTVTDWGKYLIGIDSVPGGDPAGDAWARPIGMSMPTGMDYFVGSWADWGNGAEIYNWTGAAWSLQSATYLPNPDNLTFSKDSSSVTIKFAYAGLGLSTFHFDVYTTGGGGSDSAIDSLANPAVTIAGWSDYYNSGALTDVYTIPEPSTLVLVGLGGLLLMCRKFFRRA